MFGSNRFLLFLSVVLVCAIALTSWQLQSGIEDKARSELAESLNTVLGTTHQAVRSWTKELQAAAQVWANTTEIRVAAKLLLAEHHDQQALLESAAQAKIRAWLRPVLTGKGYQGYFVTGPDQINLASSRDQNIGQKNPLTIQEAFFQKIWSGKTAVSLPVKSDVPLPDKDGNLRQGLPTMFVGAPIKDEAGKVLAAFTFRINPTIDFTTILQQARIGNSGETYAFDKQGLLISNSRFDDQLRNVGLLKKTEESILNLWIKDPGVNLMQGKENIVPVEQRPLTFMASKAATEQSGINLDGYRDYRGVPVVGAWFWDHELGFGIATELDVSEAYQTLRATRYTMLTLTLLLIFLSIAITIIYLNNRVRKHAQQALEESEARLTNFFQASFEGIFLHEDGNILDANPATTAVFGYDPEETIGSNLLEFVAPESREMVMAYMASGHEGPYEVGIVAKKGSTIPVEVRAKTMNRHGKQTRVVGLHDITERKLAEEALRKAHDEVEMRVQERTTELAQTNEELKNEIAERKRAEEGLRENEQKLRLITDNTPAFISYIDKDLRYRFNNKAYEWFGVAPEELYGKHVRDVHSEAAYLKMKEELEATLSGEATTFENFISNKAGDERYISGTHIPDFDDNGEVKGIYVFANDITERRRAEEELRESELTLSAIFEQAAVGVAMIETRSGKFLRVNQKYCDIVGYSSEEIQSPDFMVITHPDDLQGDLDNMQLLLDGKIHEFSIEKRYLRKDGSVVWVNLTVSSMWKTGEQLDYHIAVVEDITERKQAENALLNIVEGTSQVFGQDFFRILVKHLANALGVQYAFVGELISEQADTIKTVVVWSGADYGENFQYKLAGTPCENVVGKELCCYPQGIQERFPDDHLLFEMGTESYVGAPLFNSNGKPLGILAVLHNKSIDNESLVKSIVSIFAGRAAVELERKQSEEKTLELLQQNRGLTQRLFQVQEAERRHLARELHDEFGQWLTALQLHTHVLSERCSDCKVDSRDNINTIDSITSQMHLGVRRMIHELRPAVLDELGLKDSLQELVDQWQTHYPKTHYALSMEGCFDDFTDTLNVTIYRVIQESLTNVAKYAEADNVSILLRHHAGQTDGNEYVFLTIEDDGKGMNPERSTKGFGIAGMRERALAAGGVFVLKSSLGKGVHIDVQLPVTTLKEA